MIRSPMPPQSAPILKALAAKMDDMRGVRQQ